MSQTHPSVAGDVDRMIVGVGQRAVSERAERLRESFLASHTPYQALTIVANDRVFVEELIPVGECPGSLGTHRFVKPLLLEPQNRVDLLLGGGERLLGGARLRGIVVLA